MNKSRLFFCALATVVLGASVACGVRGRPQAPETPPELGRGQPSFKRATEEFAFPDVPQVGATPQPTPAQRDSK